MVKNLHKKLLTCREKRPTPKQSKKNKTHKFNQLTSREKFGDLIFYKN
jgi:hypothetical protein